jgi:hypothetical protein
MILAIFGMWALIRFISIKVLDVFEKRRLN